MYSNEQFKRLYDEISSEEARIMSWKADAYRKGDDDVLLNFRQVANLTGQRPSQVAMTYLLKHIQTLAIAVKKGEYAWAWWEEEGGEGLKQRIADARNYLLLLAACIDEEDSAKHDAIQKILKNSIREVSDHD